MSVFKCQGQDIPLKYKPSLRAKRLSLRLSAKDATLVLTIPQRAKEFQIQAFLKQCEPWVERQLIKASDVVSIRPGENVALHGTVFQCVTDPLRTKPVLCRITHTLRLPARCVQKDLYALFKKLAEEVLVSYVEGAARILGQCVEKITIKDTKSRWGSCSGNKTISLSWRLILVPPEVAQYVCAHEAAHLLHMNHSQAFWKTVGELCPAYKSHRKWLKLKGPGLMRV